MQRPHHELAENPFDEIFDDSQNVTYMDDLLYDNITFLNEEQLQKRRDSWVGMYANNKEKYPDKKVFDSVAYHQDPNLNIVPENVSW